MKLLMCFSFIMVKLLSVVNCHPVNMICVPICNTNITADEELVEGWLNHSSTTGVHQLRNHKGTVVHRLLKEVLTDVS